MDENCYCECGVHRDFHVLKSCFVPVNTEMDVNLIQQMLPVTFGPVFVDNVSLSFPKKVRDSPHTNMNIVYVILVDPVSESHRQPVQSEMEAKTRRPLCTGIFYAFNWLTIDAQSKNYSSLVKRDYFGYNVKIRI